MLVSFQLLTDARDAESLFRDSAFCAEEKLDGDRCLVVKRSNELAATSRNGHEVRLSDETIALLMLCPDCILDGELMKGGRFVPFDVLSLNGKDCRGLGQEDRAAILRAEIALPAVRRAIGENDKRGLFDAIKREKGEGVVFKRLDADYRECRNDDWQRFKLYECESFVVAEVHLATSSVTVERNGVIFGRVACPLSRLPLLGDSIRVRYERVTDKGMLLRARLAR